MLTAFETSPTTSLINNNDDKITSVEGVFGFMIDTWRLLERRASLCGQTFIHGSVENKQQGV